MERLIYFDHAATTPMDPQVFEVMKPYFADLYGNPSSIYRFGQIARRAVDEARQKTAGILECTPREIVFTSCGTESNNLFILGAAAAYGGMPINRIEAAAYKKHGRHIITTNIEHDSVKRSLEFLASQGFEISFVPVGENGVVHVSDIEKALRDDTIFVTIMYANNEIGVIQPIKEISEIVKNFRAQHSNIPHSTFPIPLLHTDACQAAPYLDISVKNLGVDALTLNGGKIYGPKGVGALFVKEGVTLVPQIHGGGQEHRMRSGTENVPAIVGFAKALALVQKTREEELKRLLSLRDKLIDGILKKIPQSKLNGDRTKRLPNNVNISFRGLEGESILLQLDMIGVAASSGSACTSGSLEPSHVIQALGLSDEWTHSSTRFSLGHENTEKEVDFVLEKLPGIIKELREASPFV